MSLEAFSKKRVLIADPLDSYCFSAKKMLIDLGLKLVSTASSAQIVLSGVQNVDYDLILCNFELGEGKNGQELLEELRVRKLLKFSCLFFIVTAEVAKDKVLGTIENEPDGYLVKPLKPEQLEKRLRTVLEQTEALKEVNSAIDQSDFAQALLLCDKKLKTDSPYEAKLLRIKAWLLTKDKQYSAAIEIYRKLLKTSNQHWARLGLAELLMLEDQLAEAEEQLNKIIGEDNKRAEAYDLLAKIKIRQQQPENALVILEKAVLLSPNSVKRQQALAESRLENKDLPGAVESYRKLIKLGSRSIYAEPKHYFKLAQLLTVEHAPDRAGEVSKNGKEALEVINKLRKKFADREQIDFQSKLAEAQIRANLGNTDAAETIFQQVVEKVRVKKDALNGESAVMAATTLTTLGKTDEVESFLEHAADLAAAAGYDVSPIYTWLEEHIDSKQRQQATELNKEGIQWHETGHLEKAIQSLSRAIPLTPHHISLNLNLIQLLVKKLKNDSVSDAGKTRSQLAECFHRIRHIPGHHKELPRYTYLKKQFGLTDRECQPNEPSKQVV